MVTAWTALLLLIPAVLILLVRFFKRPMAAFHRVVTNKITVTFAAYVPGFAVITNTGRKTGKIYRTPVNIFRERDGFVVALTYGRQSGWVANVLAAGACELETRGILYHLVSPIVVEDRSRRRFPILVRSVLGLIDANDYLRLYFRDNEQR